MFAKTWEVGDLVWAKMKGFPYWPGKIVDPPSSKSANLRKLERYVYFFGSKNFGWVMNDCIVPHSDSMISNCKKKRGLQAAVDEIIEAALTYSPGKAKPNIPSVDEDLSIIAASIPKNKEETEKKKRIKSSKRPLSESTPKSHRSFKVRKVSETLSPSYSSDPTRIAIIRPFDDPPSALSSPNAGTSAELNGTSEMEYVRPTNKIIGFLGLGSIIGRCIVRNLLKSRHRVIVYDSNPSKTEGFEKAGAVVKSSPLLVVEAADIIFSCFTDPETAKDVVLRPISGVLQGLKGTQGNSKGYVEMSFIDKETSEGIAEVIRLKGGKYLEAPITGGRKLAEQGLLTILGSGDKSLFNDCETCFHAIAQHAHFLGSDVGKSIQLNVILNTLMGSLTGVLVETLALAKRISVSEKDFLETLKVEGFMSPFLYEKGQAVLNQNFSVDTLLKHQHDAITTALSMGEEVDQPMPVITSVNELYKHARSLGYSDHDMAAVYQGARF